jgi:hypothetical protein
MLDAERVMQLLDRIAAVRSSPLISDARTPSRCVGEVGLNLQQQADHGTAGPSRITAAHRNPFNIPCQLFGEPPRKQ